MSAAPRIWLVGFGTVGRWLAEALARAPEHGRIVGIGSARDGFVADPAGIDPEAALALRRAGRPLRDLTGVVGHTDALAGIRAGDADVLIEAGLSPAADGEPGLSHMREALGRGISVVATNKWPVALAGAELAALAERNGAAFRAESTVMSGTPLLGPLTEGLAGARPLAIRGVLNATNNFILTRAGEGASYEEALAEAQRRGLAEPDPAADVDGLDTAAKLMVLSALVFGIPLGLDRVERRGISGLTAAELKAARADGLRLREVASLEPALGGEPLARVEPVALHPGDPLAAIEGTANALVCEVEPLGRITISGPGAGPELAGQGALADLIEVGRELGRARVSGERSG